MKRMLSLLLLCLLLPAAGCGQAAEAGSSAPASGPEPEISASQENEPRPEEEAPAPMEVWITPEETSTPVEVSHEGARIALDIPAGWEYEVEEYSEEDGLFGLRFRPEGEAGWIRLECLDWFGVCGTGLETEEISFPSGLTGEMGTYDGGERWDYIAFSRPEGEDRSYVATTESADGWWPDCGEAAMEILASARLG